MIYVNHCLTIIHLAANMLGGGRGGGGERRLEAQILSNHLWNFLNNLCLSVSERLNRELSNDSIFFHIIKVRKMRVSCMSLLFPRQGGVDTVVHRSL